MTNFTKVTKTKKAMAAFLSGIAVKHGCNNCKAGISGGCSGVKNCEHMWYVWLGDREFSRGDKNFNELAMCPEILADFIAYEFAIEEDCNCCPVSPCDRDETCCRNITDWLYKEVEK